MITMALDLTKSALLIWNGETDPEGIPDCDWFSLSNYSDTMELMSDCQKYFGDTTKDFEVLHYENIPDELIINNQLSPNYFLLVDALQNIETEEWDDFISWCQHHTYNLADENPYSLVERYCEKEDSEIFELMDEIESPKMDCTMLRSAVNGCNPYVYSYTQNAEELSDLYMQ